MDNPLFSEITISMSKGDAEALISLLNTASTEFDAIKAKYDYAMALHQVVSSKMEDMSPASITEIAEAKELADKAFESAAEKYGTIKIILQKLKTELNDNVGSGTSSELTNGGHDKGDV